MKKMKTRELTDHLQSDDYRATYWSAELALGWTGVNLLRDRGPGAGNFLRSYWFFLLTFCNVSICVLGEVIFFFKALGIAENFLDVTALAPCIGFCMLSLQKQVTLVANRAQLQSLVRRLGATWPRGALPPGRRALRDRHAARLRYSVLSFSWMYAILIWLFNLFPLLEMCLARLQGAPVVKELPYTFWFPFDPHTAVAFPTVYIVQIIAGATAACGIVGSDCLLVTLTNHLCMSFALLQDELMTLVSSDGAEIKDQKSFKALDAKNFINSHSGKREASDSAYRKLANLVKTHQMLIDATHELEQVFNLSILVSFICSSIIICLVGFQATANDTKMLVKFLMFLLSTMVQVYMICWYADQLMRTSGGLTAAAYDSAWCDADARLRKGLLLIMCRSQRPSYITALKFSTVSLNSFMTILSTSWSYFTLLRTMYNPSN